MKLKYIILTTQSTVMTFCVPNNDEVYCFVEQLSVTRHIKPSLKLNTKCDIARCQGVLRITNSMSLTQKKTNTNCENYTASKNCLYMCLTVMHFVRVLILVFLTLISPIENKVSVNIWSREYVI